MQTPTRHGHNRLVFTGDAVVREESLGTGIGGGGGGVLGCETAREGNASYDLSMFGVESKTNESTAPMPPLELEQPERKEGAGHDDDKSETVVRGDRRGRRTRVSLLVLVPVLIVFFIGAIIGATTRGGDSSSSNGSDRSETEIREEVRRHFADVDLDDCSSPYVRAVRWMAAEDPTEPHPSDDNFVQRFTAVYLYFATTESGPWRSCNPPKEEKGEDDSCVFQTVDALRLNERTHAFWYPKASARWLSGAHECSWAGFFCNDLQQVQALDLSGAGLSGEFPEGVYRLSELEWVDLHFGNLTGALPVGISSMSRLTEIDLSFNSFSGEIPEEWWRKNNWKKLCISHNNLEGTLSSDVGYLGEIEMLKLDGNMLEGGVPEELGRLTNLTDINLSENLFRGPLPNATMTPVVLKLFLHRNYFTGPIPAGIGSMKNVFQFTFHHNTLSGTLPAELYDLTSVRHISLNRCNLTGELSPDIGKLAKLESLDLSYNNFYGQIPDEVDGLVEIDSLRLQGNNLTGTMPAWLCEERSPTAFYVLEADCSETVVDGVTIQPELVCPEGCCTLCCDSNGICDEDGEGWGD